MQIQLSWIDPATGERREPMLETPVALGREFASMPQEIDGNRVARIVLANEQVAEYHALIDVANGELIVVDQNSSTGTLINSVRLPSSTLIDGDRLQIGPYEIQLNPSSSQTTSSLGIGA
ncbi:MAG TPA: FHA domain-containing protein, partial [Phormidium sp.]